MQVRRATTDDSAVWLKMRQALWPEGASDHPFEIASYFAGRLRMPLEVLLAFDDAGLPVGFVELSIRPYAEGCDTDSVAYLEGWYVVPEARCRGVGRALVRPPSSGRGEKDAANSRPMHSSTTRSAPRRIAPSDSRRSSRYGVSRNHS